MSKDNDFSALPLAALGAVFLLAAMGESEDEPQPKRKPQRKRKQADPSKGQRQIMPGGSIATNQPVIINSLWSGVADKDEAAVSAIMAGLSSMTPELQCYAMAAAGKIKSEYQIWLKSISDFETIARQIDADVSAKQKQVDAIHSTGASLLNLVPGVGQILSAVAALAIVLGKLAGPALAKAAGGKSALEIWRNRLSDMSFLMDWEGSDAYKGLKLSQRYPSEGFLKRSVNGDLIASRLPDVPFATKYYFTPTLSDYQAAAKAAGLYHASYLSAAYSIKDVWNGSEQDDNPTTAADIRQYLTGYDLGIAQSPYDNANPWFTVGYADAEARRPRRVGVDLQLWADKINEEQ